MSFFYEPELLPRPEDAASGLALGAAQVADEILALDDLEKLLVTSLEEVANQSATVPIGMLGQADDEELVNCDTSSKMDNTTDMHEAEDSDLSSVDAHEDSEAT